MVHCETNILHGSAGLLPRISELHLSVGYESTKNVRDDTYP